MLQSIIAGSGKTDERNERPAHSLRNQTVEMKTFAAAPYEGLLTSLQIDGAEKEVISNAVAQEPQHPFADLQRYAEKENLQFVILEDLGVNLVKFAMNTIVKNCPADGSVKEIVPENQNVGGQSGWITDRFFRNNDFTYCHIRCFNKQGVANEVEQVFEKENHVKVHVFRTRPDAEVKIAAVTPDSQSGCMITIPASHLRNVLTLIQ